MALKAAIALLIASFLLAFCAYYYHGKYNQASSDLKLATATIKDMQVRQRDVAALDAKYTKELTDAKETIDQLERDVAAGNKRLSVHARCVPKTTGSTSVDDGGYARLDDAAQRDYFTLRKRIAEVTAMSDGQKEYIRTQCLR